MGGRASFADSGELFGTAAARLLVRGDDGWCPDPIIVFDAAGRLTFVNRAATDLAGVRDVELVGLGIAEIGAILGGDLEVGIEAVLTSGWRSGCRR